MADANVISAEEEFVQSDNAPVEGAGDASKGESLGKISPSLTREYLLKPILEQEAAALDESNIIDSKTRGAKPEGGYTEPSEDDIGEQ